MSDGHTYAALSIHLHLVKGQSLVMHMFPLWASNLLGAELDGHPGQRERSPGINAVCHDRIDFTGLDGLLLWLKNVLTAGLLKFDKSRLFPRSGEECLEYHTDVGREAKGVVAAGRQRGSFSEAVGRGGGGWEGGKPLTQHAGSQPRNRFISPRTGMVGADVHPLSAFSI